MTAPSYATAAAAAVAPASSGNSNGIRVDHDGNNGSSMKPQGNVLSEEDLYKPPPTSMVLSAALMLLDSPLVVKTKEEHVFLMTRAYLQNWLFWAYYEAVPPEETRRLQRALKLAAEMHKLKPPALNTTEFHDPGPVDSRALSDKVDPFLLREGMRVESSTDKNEKGGPIQVNDSSATDICCAVPEAFYEVLRSVHGIVCRDGVSIAFQPHFDNYHEPLLYHYSNRMRGDVQNLRPVEFRRRVMLVPQSSEEKKNMAASLSKLDISDKKKEEEEERPRLIPRVELYPTKIIYSIISKNNGDIDSDVIASRDRVRGFVLASRASLVVETMPAIIKEVAPDKSSACVRLWSKRHALRQDNKTDATARGDGFDLIHLKRLDGKKIKQDVPEEPSKMIMQEWVTRQNGPERQNSVEILVETRMNTAIPWARTSLEFENRLQVGDYVDGQDSDGHWFESVVRTVTEDTVVLHYVGWASKWDTTVRRYPTRGNIQGVSKAINSPAPLWSHVPRWRERIKPGDLVEVRDSASQAKKPRWFRGTVKAVSREGATPKELINGAPLEEFDASRGVTNGQNGKKRPLLFLDRTRQVKVDVPQEKRRDISGSSDPYQYDATALRWLDLYSEEICQKGTHIKWDDVDRPATLRYDYDTRRPPVEVLKTFNNAHGSGFIRESLRGQPPAPGSVGLQNLGNSCFMNSVVQCVNHMEPLTRYFLSGGYKDELNRTNPLGSGGMVSMAYAQLLSDIWGGEYTSLAPRLLKQTVANFAPQFNNIYQHDSHEFCSFFMDGLHEDCNRVQSKPYVEDLEGFGMADDKVAIESWRKHLLRHDSIVVDHCQGLHRSHVTCPVCGRESIKFDVFSSISLPLSSGKGGGSIPLEDCLEKFTEGEQLDENNAWYCENCKKHVCALKMLALWSVPDILILHLKRFTYEHRGGGVVRNKIEDTVVFPIDGLDMQRYILGPVDEETPPVYNLFGVSEHSGATANSGHYTATVRNSKDGNWYRYNDSHVGTSSGEASVTGGAYLLFYKRAKGTSRWAGMEKVMLERSINPKGALDTDQDGFKQVKGKNKKKKRKS